MQGEVILLQPHLKDKWAVCEPVHESPNCPIHWSKACWLALKHWAVNCRRARISSWAAHLTAEAIDQTTKVEQSDQICQYKLSFFMNQSMRYAYGGRQGKTLPYYKFLPTHTAQWHLHADKALRVRKKQYQRNIKKSDIHLYLHETQNFILHLSVSLVYFLTQTAFFM